MKFKYIKRLVYTLVLGIFILMVFPFAKLTLTDIRVTKTFLFDTYFVKITSNQDDFEVFTEYMDQKGWRKVEQLGGLHIFEKDGLKKRILNTQVKTLLVDGKLNLDY